MSRLAQRLRLAPHPVVAGTVSACARIIDLIEFIKLVPDELLPSSIAAAVSARRSSFIAGRLCAESAAAMFQFKQRIERGSYGEPVWPGGLLGSITHNETWACAVVTRAGELVGVGIDSESIALGDAYRAIETVACTEQERRLWMHGEHDGLAATVIFSAKEALYKALHPRVRRFIDPLEVQVTKIDWSNRTLAMRAVPASDTAQILRIAICQFVVEEATVHASVFIDRGKLRG